MAIIANRNRVMTRFLPGIEKIFHYMAIGTGIGVICKIGISPSVIKSERTYSDKNPKAYTNRY